MPDSSAVHPTAALFDGERHLVACTADHLDELVRHYYNRPYDEEELWAHMLMRAARSSPEDPTLEDLAFITGLSVTQVMRGLRWKSIWFRWVSHAS